jgi:hypothetical protein
MEACLNWLTIPVGILRDHSGGNERGMGGWNSFSWNNKSIYSSSAQLDSFMILKKKKAKFIYALNPPQTKEALGF